MILYQFGAEWCNPCKVQREVLTNNPIEGADYVFVDCDEDENEELVDKYGIVDLPTLLLMDKDKVLTSSRNSPSSSFQKMIRLL